MRQRSPEKENALGGLWVTQAFPLESANVPIHPSLPAAQFLAPSHTQ